VIHGPKEQCPACGDLMPIPTPETRIIASGGWCAPSTFMSDDLLRLPRICGACLAAQAIGIPRAVLDGITTVTGGGITY
jgi:ribosomal protein S27AE